MNRVTNLGNRTLIIDNCVLSYPHLFQARRAGKPGQQTGDPRFSADFILPVDLTQEDINVIAAVYEEAVAMKWPNPNQRPPTVGAVFDFSPQFKTPFKDATNGGKNPQFQGRVRIATGAKESAPPKVLQEMGPAMYEPVMDQTQVFAGCIVKAHIQFYAYTTGSNGISCGLEGVLLVDNLNVERLDNRQDSAAAFAQAAGHPAPIAATPQPGGPQVPAHQQVVQGQPVNPAAPMPQVQTVSPQPAQPAQGNPFDVLS